MLTCPECGAELKEGAKFCMECGTSIPQVKECPECGTELPVKAKFCYECGASQDAEDVEEEEDELADDEPAPGCTVLAQNKEHLQQLIDEAIDEDGVECDLNFIDVRLIKDMSSLFAWDEDSHRHEFKGDISQWNVSNVEDMSCMFYGSEFDGDISDWDVSCVTDMHEMFVQSKFNGDISLWDVSSVTTMHEMFNESWFDGDISQWDVSSVTDMGSMFLNSQSEFSYGFDGWDVSKVKTMSAMFMNCRFSDCDMMYSCLSRWRVSRLACTGRMFDGSSLEQFGRLPRWYRG